MLNIRSEGTDRRRILRLSGECDIATAPRLHEALTPLRGEVRELVLDLSGLDFIDSSGIAVVAGALKWLRESDATLVVTGAHGPVRKAFEITGLDRAIPLLEADHE